MHQLQIQTGHYSDAGLKPSNQDCVGSHEPTGVERTLKGYGCAIADGISTSSVSQMASALAVKQFLEDYYCTSEAWSVAKSAQTVLQTINAKLCQQTQHSPYRYDKDKGYVTTFSGVIFKTRTAHLFHIGDSRIYRLSDRGLEQLTQDHRTWTDSKTSYLSRALGAQADCHIDYQTIPLASGDYFLLTTDGIHEHTDPAFIIDTLRQHPANLNLAARDIASHALEQGSRDNLSLQIIYIADLPADNSPLFAEQIGALPLPPELKVGDTFEQYHILKPIYHSARSHVFLAQRLTDKTKVAIKVPATEFQHEQYLEHFLTEEWIARKLDNPHVLKAAPPLKQRKSLHIAFDYFDGITLTQWVHDHPNPDLETVRGIVEQVGRGLQAFHRHDMLHQDIRPENILIDANGFVKLIDFGSTFVPGISEINVLPEHPLKGTALYSAPEYFLGQPGTKRSDIFSLGVLTYFLLSGHYPYGTKVAGAKTVAMQRRLTYRSLISEHSTLPFWLDETLRKAVSINPLKRYEETSELLHDLRVPNPDILRKSQPPLLERNPVAVWQGISFVLFALTTYLLFT